MNPSGALIYLVGTLMDLYIVAIMLRLMLQWVRADFYNPLCQFLVKITNPALVPARRLLPSIGRLDTASVVLMLLLELIQLIIINQISQSGFDYPFMFLFAIKKLLLAYLLTNFVLVIARVVISWIGTHARHPLLPLVYQLTEPLFRPFRRLIPPIAGMDLSPLFVLITLRFLLLLLGW